jgi:arginase
LTALDRGDVVVPDADPPVLTGPRNERALAMLAGAIRESVGAALDGGLLPLLLGGDHSVSLGSVAASAARAPVGVLWFDAHGDFNTPETSPSGNVYGMVLAILAGLGPAPLVQGVPTKVPGSRIAIIGARALDPGERQNLRDAGVAVYTTEAIRAFGPEQAVERAIAAGAERLHVSFDLDVLDPSVAPGVWTRAHDGFTLDEARASLRAVANSGRLMALDVTELFPARDRAGVTARAALSLIKTALARPRGNMALDWRAVQANLRSSA